MRRLMKTRLYPDDVTTRRRRSVKALVALASLLAFLGVFAIWVERQALDTDEWVQTSSGMLENAQIRSAVSEFLVEKLYENVDVEGELESVLPGFTKELAGGLADGAEGIAEGGGEAALETSAARTLWEVANRTAHEELLSVLEDKGEVVSTGGGDVSLNLGALLRNLGEQLGIDQKVVEDIPTGSAQIQILHSGQLSTAQTAVKAIKGLALVLSLLALLVFALAIYLSRGARGATVLLSGAGLIGAGLGVILLRIVAGHLVVDQLVTDSSAEPAAEAAWSIGTSLLADVAWTVVIAGILFVAAGWLASTAPAARRVRGLTAPFLQRYPALFYANLALLVLMYFVSGSADSMRTALTVLTMASFAAFGIHALRGQTEREFPEARDSRMVAGLADRAGRAVRDSGVADLLSRMHVSGLSDRQQSPGREDPPPAAEQADAEEQPEEERIDEETRLARLRQLGELRRSGVLDDDEFAAMKARLLPRRGPDEDEGDR